MLFLYTCNLQPLQEKQLETRVWTLNKRHHIDPLLCFSSLDGRSIESLAQEIYQLIFISKWSLFKEEMKVLHSQFMLAIKHNLLIEEIKG